jgi:hypothetical protein
MLGTVAAAVRDWGDDHVMGFLDTPMETCIQRVRDRRLEKGNLKPFDPEKTLVKDYRAVSKAKINAVTAGFNVVTVNHSEALDDTLLYLRNLLAGAKTGYPSCAKPI